MDSYGWMKTLILVELKLPVADKTLPEKVEIGENGDSVDFKIMEFANQPPPPGNQPPHPRIPATTTTWKPTTTDQ
jgi:hypothetical protein